jgi:Kef-type K+ transport system membrane component KefB
MLGEGVVPSLFVGTAMMATSVGVSVFVWREEGLLETPAGGLMLDAAELDDISSVVLLAVLLHAAPVIHGGGAGLGAALTAEIASLLGKLALLVIGCAAFARWLEAPLLRYLERLEGPTDRTLTVAAVGVMVAGLSGLLGFSVAIGAFFAGLAFSRDPHAVRIDASFDPIYHLLTPFFFISIGLAITPGLSLTGVAALLVAVAVVGKLVGHGVPALGPLSRWSALTLGLSMVPRAEIAMVVMQEGHRLGEWAVPAALFSGMVVVSAVTCLLGPLAVRALLRAHPPEAAEVS